LATFATEKITVGVNRVILRLLMTGFVFATPFAILKIYKKPDRLDERLRQQKEKIPFIAGSQIDYLNPRCETCPGAWF
jgi:hypothetical protein